MNTVKAILENINKQEYYVDAYHVQRMLKEIIKEGSKLKQELTLIAEGIDFTNNREVIAFINQTILEREEIKGKTITNTILEEFFAETQNQFFKTLIEYRKSFDRYTKVASFIKNVIDPNFNKKDKRNVKSFMYKENFDRIAIQPAAKVNASGGISISNPSLPFGIEDVKNILGYNVAIPCDNMDGLSFVLSKYKELIICCAGKAKRDEYIVIGNTLYAQMIVDEFDADPFAEESYFELIREFQRKYLDKREANEEIIRKVEEKKDYFVKQAKHVEEVKMQWENMFKKLKETKEN